jgi:ATP-dependent Clp endopeptidase proteolytic subunit ClpP
MNYEEEMISHKIDPLIKVKKLEDLLEPPVMVHVNKFDEDAAKKFEEEFEAALSTGQKVVPVVIDSYGGQVYSLMAMVDIIKSSPMPVATIVSGKAMSCGAILFSCGTEGYRFMGPSATVMIHDVSSFVFGKVEDIKADAKEVERLNQHVYHLMARNVGKQEDYFLKIVHEQKGHADWFLTAQECLSHNLANQIKIPSFKVKVSAEISFEG